MNYTDLSKERLSELMQSDGICKYKAIKKPNAECDAKATVAWGYCSRHSRTVQAKRAKDKYEELLQSAKREDASVDDGQQDSPDIEQPVENHQEDEQIVHEISEEENEEELPLLKSEINRLEKTLTGRGSKRSNRRRETPPTPRGSKVDTRPVKSTGARSKTSVVHRGGKKIVKRSIKKNYWGNYEDTETHIVFNAAEKCAIGIQHHSGNIQPLTNVQIELCKRMGWKYSVPKRSTSIRNISFDDESEYDESESDESEESEESEYESDESEEESEYESDSDEESDEEDW